MDSLFLSALFGFFNDSLLLLLCGFCIFAVWRIAPFKSKLNYVLIGMGVFAVNLLAGIVDTRGDSAGLSVLSFLLTILPHYLFITLLYRKVDFKCYAVTLACRIVSLGLSYLAVLLKYPGVFDLANLEMGAASLRMDILFRAVLCVPAALWCIRSAKRAYYNWATMITTPVFLLCSGMFVSYFVLIWLLFAPEEFRVDVHFASVLIIVFTAIFFVTIPYVLHHLIRSRFYASFVSKQLDTQVAFYEEMQKRNQDMHAFRHDCVNYMQCVRDLLSEGKTEEAITFLDSLNADLSATRQAFYSGNFLLDAILSDKQAKASDYGITIQWEGAFPKQGIENVDLCAMMSNALDNAIEECRKQENATILVLSKQEENRVYLRIQNPVSHAVHIHDGTIETTKKDKVSHGFGLQNIKKAAEKYDGTMHPSISSDGLFTLDIELRYR